MERIVAARSCVFIYPGLKPGATDIRSLRDLELAGNVHNFNPALSSSVNKLSVSTLQMFEYTS